jgi:pseudouridine-5'-phosphate glycosidase/pseudouridine kinase
MLARKAVFRPSRTKFLARYFHGPNLPIHISEEIKQAISENLPVVALESTIITHGLPYPENISMAKQVEQLIRSNGAIPATIGFVKGIPTIGVNETDLELLGKSDMQNVKISRRDIPYVMTRKLTGGTTIAATMILANLAGIDVFSTGGLGGISRPWTLFDVSADLDELSKTPIAVVCSGPKSILDIQRTMEYLETKGVPVSTYIDEAMKNKLDFQTRQTLEILCQSKDPKDLNAINSLWEKQHINVPGFYVRDSGVKSPYIWENTNVAATTIYSGKYEMGLDNGYVFCAPAPIEVAMDKQFMDELVNETLILAEQNGISGKNLTPFMLQKLYEKTNGASAECNVAFVKNNAVLGSKIARELSIIKGGKHSKNQSARLLKNLHQKIRPKAIQTTKLVEDPKIMIIGSVALDTTCSIGGNVKRHDSNPGKISESVGGVGFNIALAATCYDSTNSVLLVTAINKSDSAGATILDKFAKSSMPTNGIVDLPNESTAQYISMHGKKGELVVACADMEITEKIPVESVTNLIEKYKPKVVLFDLNISVRLMNEILTKADKLDIKIMIEPTSGVKCAKLGQCQLEVYPKTQIELLTPTIEELSTIYNAFVSAEHLMDIDNWFSVLDIIGAGGELRDQLDRASNRFPLIKDYLQKGVFQQAFQLLPYFPNLVIKDGSNGILVVQITSDAESAAKNVSKTTYGLKKEHSISDFVIVSNSGRHNHGIVIQHYPAHHVLKPIVNVTGAGDSLVGCLISQLSENTEALSDISNPSRDTLFEHAQQCAIASLDVSGAVNCEVLTSIREGEK